MVTLDNPIQLLDDPQANPGPPRRKVTGRSLLLGAALTLGVAGLNCWVESLYNVHFVGGIQMPFASVFVLMVLVLGFNLPLRGLQRVLPFTRCVQLFSAGELATIYVMTMFGALISTPGCDNSFLVMGPDLFYFSFNENKWADLFYRYVPTWFTPGWNGHAYSRKIIDPFFDGGVSVSRIPWHAWAPMLAAWSIFLLLIYSLLFFVALIFRAQWIEHEALTFPLVELPLRMVEPGFCSHGGEGPAPPSKAFWSSGLMWAGFGLAFAFHFLLGMHSYFVDWPSFTLNMNQQIAVVFTEHPWDSIPEFNLNLYLGAIGVAYLLTREISFSFWFFFLAMLAEHAVSTLLGFPVGALEKSGIMGRPAFIIFQGVGGWIMMAGVLIWTARGHLTNILRAAWKPAASNLGEEPFSGRFIIGGFVLSLAGLLAWTSIAGINLFFATFFFGMFLVTSLVLTRLVIEGGFLFPQAPYLFREVATTGFFGTAAMGAGTLTKLSFLEPVILFDMRTNTLPAFLHTMKLARALDFDRGEQRRLLGGAALAILLTVTATLYFSLKALYWKGANLTYGGNWGKAVFTSTASLLHRGAAVEPANVFWMIFGAAVVLLIIGLRTRFFWFPLHPLGYLACAAYPITQLWCSFFLGWLIKSTIMKYAGSQGYNRVTPFMIGLIFGNLCAMVFWMFIGFKTGVQLTYWPA